MPIYEYQCNACSNCFETLVLGRDVPACPACSSTDLSKLMSKCGFVTAGSSSSGADAPSVSASSSCSGCSGTSCSTCASG